MNKSSMVVSRLSSFGTKARLVSSRGALAVFTAATLFACSVGESYVTDSERLGAEDSEHSFCGCEPQPGDTGSGATGAGQSGSVTTSVGSGGIETGSGTTVGSGAGGANGGSGGVSCIHDVDCPPLARECSASKCVLGLCGHTNMSAGTPAQAQVSGDCHRRTCDGSGNVINVVDDTDAPPSSAPCSAPSCKLGAVMNTWAPEGSWCSGGVCSKVGSCVECVCDADCGGGTCNALGHCVAPSCTDGVRNGSECDVDCGQGCKPCGSGRSCSRGSDCTLGVCLGLLGAKLCL